MSRGFGTLNKAHPVWLVRMSKTVPSCFDHPAWVSYLEGVQLESQDNNPLRMSLHRGQVPDYCAECTSQHQKRMHRLDRCAPPAGAQSPLLLVELQQATT